MNDRSLELARKHFAIRDGVLLVGGISVHDLAGRYGTPSFIYDRAVMDRKLDALRSALPPSFSIYYSVKANPNQAVLRHFLSRGCGLEIASAGEFRCALAAGCEPRKILFAGPGKTEWELEEVLSHGIGEIHAESMTEIQRLISISRRLKIRPKIALRINPAAEGEGGAMRMGGRPAPFGIDEESIDLALEAIKDEAALELGGIHLFAGTQILDATTLVKQYAYGVDLARRVTSKIGHPLETVDFGGGLGIPYFSQEKELDLGAVRVALMPLFEDVSRSSDFKGTRFLVEPGRFLVGEAGVYLARVNDIKISRGKKFLVLDGGMNHHLAASGNLGQTIKRNYPVAIGNRMGLPEEEAVDVVGPLCTPLDTLARNVSLPKAEIGDLFVIFQSGAYGRTASPQEFLGHAAPPEIFVDSGRAMLVHPRGSLRPLLDHIESH